MNVIDVIIILMLGLGALVGFKRGFIKQTTSFIGLVVILILSFMLKNPISVFFYEYLPFFKFGGSLKGIEILNVIVYELIAFLIVFSILSILLRIVISISGIIEKILNATIILGIPSKILGMIMGFLVAYIYIFIALFILTQPVFNIDLINESEWKDKVLLGTKILPGTASSVMTAYSDIYELIEKNNNNEDVNAEILDLFLKNKIITVNSADRLISKGKLTIPNSESIIGKYRGV